jgi:copper transport protein
MKRLSFLLLALLGLLATATAVSAHAELVSAEPAPGASLAQAPTQFTLTFSEPLQMGSSLLLTTADFTTIPIATQLHPDAPNTLLGDNVPSLAPGIYTMQWLIISSDGHSQTGSYQFLIGGTMLTSLALAESAAFNPPAIAAWLMIALALGTPIVVRFLFLRRR